MNNVSFDAEQASIVFLFPLLRKRGKIVIPVREPAKSRASLHLLAARRGHVLESDSTLV